ncbi:MAG: hypothetical protein QG580_326 [Patescibacteria group bacterium]|nr:hypothetical protein [Patescibacteria group bacterium]
MKGAPLNEKNERGFIIDRGDMTEDELLLAVKKRREKRKGLKN